MTLTELRPDVVILTCAISAGIHGALVPDHLDEGTGAGLGFAVATLLLAAVIVALTVRPVNPPAVVGAAAVLGGLIGSYALAVTTGFPLLHPEAEPVEGLALATKAVEAVGLITASMLLRRPSHRLVSQPKGT